jgi:hypothetical protein
MAQVQCIPTRRPLQATPQSAARAADERERYGLAFRTFRSYQRAYRDLDHAGFMRAYRTLRACGWSCIPLVPLADLGDDGAALAEFYAMLRAYLDRRQPEVLRRQRALRQAGWSVCPRAPHRGMGGEQ